MGPGSVVGGLVYERIVRSRINLHSDICSVYVDCYVDRVGSASLPFYVEEVVRRVGHFADVVLLRNLMRLSQISSTTSTCLTPALSSLSFAATHLCDVSCFLTEVTSNVLESAVVGRVLSPTAVAVSARVVVSSTFLDSVDWGWCRSVPLTRKLARVQVYTSSNFGGGDFASSWCLRRSLLHPQISRSLIMSFSESPNWQCSDS